MYNATTVKEAIFGATPLIAWRQEENPANPTLDSAIVTPTSGKYFNEAHPYLTLDRVFSIAPRFQDYVYTAYNATNDFVVDAIVSKGGLNWICILAHEVADEGAQDPEAGSSIYWSEWTTGNQRSKWIKEKTQGYSLSVIDDILDYKKWTRTAKSIIEERPLFDGAASLVDLTAAKNKTVGFEIRVNRRTSVLAKLSKIALHLDQSQVVTIRLMHSSSNTAKQTLAVTGGASSVFVDLNWELPYISGDDAGGTYRIEFEHTAASVNHVKDWTPNPINRQGFGYNSWKLWSPYVDMHPYEVATADKDDPSKRVFAYNDNFGMNLMVSVYCDYTAFFVRQLSAFQSALSKGIAVKFLREIAMNPNARISHNESTGNISKDELLYEIDGNPQGRATGLGKEYEIALKAVLMDTEGLDEVCFPCTKKKLRMSST